MQVQLPDDPKIESRASVAGFASVEDYVRDLVARDTEEADDSGTDSSHRRMTHEQWRREFRKLLDLVKSSNPGFDDSRESMYPVR